MQWVQLEKISSLGDLIPDLVHKLNDPLASVAGYAQLLLPKSIDPEAKENLEKIIEETHQASQIIKDLVEFAKEKKPRKEVVDLNDLINKVLDMKTPELNLRNINVVKQLSPPIPPTLMDQNQIQQVLLNLISNAEQAISGFHGFGIIRVETRVMNGQIEMMVSDDGSGITKENIPKVVNPFFTTKKKRIGLGLAISYDMIIEHGGTMKVGSNIGEGTTFMITFPLTQVEVEKKGEKKRSTEISLKGMNGLVIDDDSTLLHLVFKYLELQGSHITAVSDVKTALGIIEGKDFDFVICDMKMPGMNGSDFYRIVKEKESSLKDRIIFSTGDVLSDTTKAFVDSVMNPCLEKPFNLNELKELIMKNVINS
jgi:CheY-like chemotaxis protein/two-component sensor histidine kinase